MKEHRTHDIKTVSYSTNTENFVLIILDASGCYSYGYHLRTLFLGSVPTHRARSRGTRASLEESSEGTEQLTTLTRAGQTKQKFFSFKDFEKRLRKETWEAGGPGETLRTLFPRAQEHFSLR